MDAEQKRKFAKEILFPLVNALIPDASKISPRQASNKLFNLAKKNAETEEAVAKAIIHGMRNAKSWEYGRTILMKLGEETVASLVGALHQIDTGQKTRFPAIIEILENHPEKEYAAKYCTAALADDNINVREAAIRVLTYSNVAKYAAKYCTGALANDNINVREAAIRVLTYSNVAKYAENHIIAALESGNNNRRTAARIVAKNLRLRH